MRQSRILYCLLLLLGVTLSCSEQPVPHVSLSMQKRIDTLFRNTTDSLEKIAIDNCVKKHDILFDKAVDSIYNQRILEIESLSN